MTNPVEGEKYHHSTEAFYAWADNLPSSECVKRIEQDPAKDRDDDRDLLKITAIRGIQYVLDMVNDPDVNIFLAGIFPTDEQHEFDGQQRDCVKIVLERKDIPSWQNGDTDDE